MQIVFSKIQHTFTVKILNIHDDRLVCKCGMPMLYT